jgi:hypothetical protein
VATFQLIYFRLSPGLGEKYAMCMVERARASGASGKSIVEATQKAADMKRMLDQPAMNAALTFAEAFPVGLVVSLLAGAILRKGQASPQGPVTSSRT